MTTLLIRACEVQDDTLVDFLIDLGADPNKAVGESFPLLSALKQGNLDLAQQLVSKGASIDRSLLETYVNKNDLETVEFLLQQGADPNQIGPCREPLLFSLIGRRKRELVRLFLKHNVNVNVATKTVSTIEKAIKFFDKEIFKDLLNGGLDVINGPRCEDALSYAAKLGATGAIEFLLKNGVDIDKLDRDEQTALMKVTQRGDTIMVDFLLKRNANPNMKSRREETALMLAAEHGYNPVIEMLLGSGADINSRERRGETALMRAAKCGRLSTVELLVERGASWKLEDRDGKTASEYAISKNYQEIVEYFYSLEE